MNEKNYEVIDLTESDQIDREPEIAAIEEPNGEGENPETVEAVETVEEIVEPEEEPAEEAAVEEETIDAGGTTEEEIPVPEDPIAARITALESQIDILVDKLNVIVSTVSNIEDMEKKRAAGPQGFFKPVPDDKEPGSKADLPRIERIYK